MALRNQPYFPLYVQDLLTDEKLIECSAEAHGVYLRLLCIMHKSNPYGTILLRQKDQQSAQQVKNFATKLDKHLPFSFEVIENALNELIEQDVIQIYDAKLSQKRMVRDNEISLLRSEAGKKGGFATAKKSAKHTAKELANSENENEYENESEIVIENKNEELKSEFEKARISFPGTKRGLDTEFENFRKKHKDWKEVLSQLHGAIDKQKKMRQELKRMESFVPEWKHFKTWINQRCWEDETELPEDEEMKKINRELGL